MKHAATQMPNGGWVIGAAEGSGSRAMTLEEAKAALRALDATAEDKKRLGLATSEELIDELSNRHAAHLLVIEHSVDGRPGETRLRVHSSLAVWTAIGLAEYACEAIRCRIRDGFDPAPARKLDG